MKKLLTAILALTMSVTCAFGLVACGKNKDKDDGKKPGDTNPPSTTVMTDEEIVTKAINNLKAIYDKKELKEQASSYEVLGQTRAGDTLCDVVWTVSWESTEYDIDDYITVGEMNADKNVTINVKKPPVAMEYLLTATVNVNNASKSFSFERSVPANPLGDEDTVSVGIQFNDSEKRTQFSTEIQVWEQNGIKLTNSKYNSSSNVANYSNPARFYSGSLVKLEYPGMKYLVWDCDYKENADYLVKSLEATGLPLTTELSGEYNQIVRIALEIAVDYIEYQSLGQTRAKTIDIDAIVGGATDADKLAAAKAALHLDKTIYSEEGEYDLPSSSYGASLTWSLKGTSDLVKVEGGKLVVEKLPTSETVVTLVASIVSGQEKGSVEVEIKLVPTLNLEHKGTADDPFTIEEVQAIAATLDADAFYEVNGKTAEICVEGYVIKVGSWSKTEYYANWTGSYIATSANSSTGSSDALYVYRLNIDGTYLKADGDLVEGAKIVVKGALQNYQGDTPEITNSGDITVVAVAYDKTPGQGDHVHNIISKTHNTGTWTHTLVCDAEGCNYTDGTHTEDCRPVLNVCPVCGHKYSESDILTALFALSSGDSLKGTYSLTGVVTEITDDYTSQYKNVTFNMTVGDKEIIVYRAKSDTDNGTDYAATVKAGDKVVITGSLINYSGKYEFESGCLIVDVIVDENAHVHNFTSKTHNAGTWTHTVVCDVDGCEYEGGTATLDCNPELNECSVCGHEYSESDILTALFALSSGDSLKGTYSLKGEVKEITDAYSSQYGNITFTITVGGRVVTVYRAKSGSGNTYAETVKVGDTVTITGKLKNYGGTCEFDSGCLIVELVPGEGTTDPGPGIDPDEPIKLPETAFPVTPIPELIASVPNSGNTASGKSYAIGVVKSISDAYNAAIYIIDEDENELYVYGLLNKDGSERYQTPSASGIIKVGDAIVVYGAMTNYNGTIEMQYAWLVQVNDDAKTDVAEVLLAETSMPTIVAADFELPTAGGAITWEVTDGEGITIEGTTAKVTRTSIDQVVVLTATAKVGDVTATKDYTITVQLEVAGEQEVLITSNALNVTGAYTNEGGGVASGVPFSWTGLGYYGNGLQMRTNSGTGTSSFWNTQAFSYNIFKVEFKFNSAQSATADILKVELADNANFNNAKTVLVSFTAGSTTVLTSLESYTFIRVTHNDKGAVYLDEVSILCKAPSDEDLVAAALDALSSTLPNVTKAEDVTLPTSTIDGVTFNWTSNDSTYTVSGGKLVVSALPEDEDKTVTLTVTATCGSVSENNTKTVTVIIKKALSAGEDIDPKFNLTAYANSNSWNSNSQFKSITVDENISIAVTASDANSGKWYGDWRIYQTGNPTITFTAKTGYVLVSIKVTYTSQNSGCLTNNGTNVASGTLIENINANTFSFGVGNTGTATNGQARITAIDIIYRAAA